MPPRALFNQWLESGDLVEALCTGLTARPFMQNKDKTPRRQGKEVKVGDEIAYLDTMVVFAGASMSTLADAKPIDERSRPPVPVTNAASASTAPNATPSGSSRWSPRSSTA